MPTIVGILTFISMINTTSVRLKARNFFFCLHFSFFEQLKFRAQLSWAWKKFITSRPGLTGNRTNIFDQQPVMAGINWHKWVQLKCLVVQDSSVYLYPLVPRLVLLAAQPRCLGGFAEKTLWNRYWKLFNKCQIYSHLLIHLIHSIKLTLNAPIATKVVCFSRLLKSEASMTNSVDTDQTAPKGAVWSGSILFASIFKLVSSLRQLFAADNFSWHHF